MNLLNVVFPKKCALCGEKSCEKDFLCEKCDADLPVMKHTCAISDLSMNIVKGEESEEKILSVYCALRYTGTVKKGIVNMKYGERPQVAEFLGYKMYDILLDSGYFNYNFADFDYVVPVPATDEKIKMRGYNQAELIARSFAQRANIPLLDGVLLKNDNIITQSSLDFAARQRSVSGVYELGDVSKILDKNIFLVDDILTTGATAIECARILYKAGARLVVALTASTGKKDI